MAVRLFDGLDDSIEAALGSVPGAKTNYTMAMCVKPDFVATNALYHWTIGDVSTDHLTMHQSTGGVIGISVNNATAQRALTAVPAAGEWYIHAATKTSGTTAPRFHRYRFSTGVWTQELSGTTKGNHTGTSDRNLFGNQIGGAGDTFDGLVAVAGFWDVALSDAQVTELSAHHATLDWFNCSGGAPLALWDFNQAATTTPVADLIGAANETVLIGTTVVTGDDPGGDWTFGLTSADNTTKPAVPGMFSPQLVETGWF